MGIDQVLKYHEVRSGFFLDWTVVKTNFKMNTFYNRRVTNSPDDHIRTVIPTKLLCQIILIDIIVQIM